MKGVEEQYADTSNKRSRKQVGLQAKAPAVHVALFGKHRVWRDFVSLNASNDATLTGLYEDVYCRCLRVLQSGVWGTDLGLVVPRFHHLVFGLNSPTSVVAGTIVGSADALGRQHPLMLAVHIQDMFYHRSIPQLTPMVRNLASQVMELTDESAILQALRRAEAWFSVRLESSPPLLPDHARGLLQGLLSSPYLDGDGEGLHRIVYQLVGHDPTGIDIPWKSPPDLRDRLPAQIRVRLDPNHPEQMIDRYFCFLRFLCGDHFPFLAFAPFDKPWADLIMGAMSDAEITPLLKLPEDPTVDGIPADSPEFDPEPYTHAIPFNLDAPFREALRTLRERALEAPPEPDDAADGERSRIMDLRTHIFEANDSANASILENSLMQKILLLLAILVAVVVFSLGAFLLLKQFSQACRPTPPSALAGRLETPPNSLTDRVFPGSSALSGQSPPLAMVPMSCRRSHTDATV